MDQAAQVLSDLISNRFKSTGGIIDGISAGAMGLLPDTQNRQLCMRQGMPGTFSPPPRVSDTDMHHGTCVTHVPWCMSGSLTSGFLWSRWRGKCSRQSRRMRNPQFFVTVRRPIDLCTVVIQPIYLFIVITFSKGSPLYEVFTTSIKVITSLMLVLEFLSQIYI